MLILKILGYLIPWSLTGGTLSLKSRGSSCPVFLLVLLERLPLSHLGWSFGDGFENMTYDLFASPTKYITYDDSRLAQKKSGNGCSTKDFDLYFTHWILSGREIQSIRKGKKSYLNIQFWIEPNSIVKCPCQSRRNAPYLAFRQAGNGHLRQVD